MTEPHKRNVAVAFGALFASSATLVCCVLPAVFVAVGAGAALAGLVSAIPQLIWLSEHKAAVFLAAAALLLVSGVLLWNGRRLPCPADPRLARACQRMRKVGGAIYGIAIAAFTVGAVFAFVLPATGT
jgi:hypothetical protein